MKFRNYIYAIALLTALGPYITFLSSKRAEEKTAVYEDNRKQEECGFHYHVKGNEKPKISINPICVIHDENLEERIEYEKPVVKKVNNKISVKPKINYDQALFNDYSISAEKIDNWFKKRESGLYGIGQCIINTSKRTNIPPQILFGIIAHESNSGKSSLTKECNNVSGFKAKRNNDFCTKRTWEVYSGKYVVKDANFIKYDNICESVMDLGKTLATSPNYKHAFRNKDINKIVEKIGERYATDPNWSNKVLKYIKNI